MITKELVEFGKGFSYQYCYNDEDNTYTSALLGKYNKEEIEEFEKIGKELLVSSGKIDKEIINNAKKKPNESNIIKEVFYHNKLLAIGYKFNVTTETIVLDIFRYDGIEEEITEDQKEEALKAFYTYLLEGKGKIDYRVFIKARIKSLTNSN